MPRPSRRLTPLSPRELEHGLLPRRHVKIHHVAHDPKNHRRHPPHHVLGVRACPGEQAVCLKRRRQKRPRAPSEASPSAPWSRAAREQGLSRSRTVCEALICSCISNSDLKGNIAHCACSDLRSITNPCKHSHGIATFPKEFQYFWCLSYWNCNIS